MTRFFGVAKDWTSTLSTHLRTSARRRKLKFVNPPVNEVGISVSFSERGAISDYHIESLHDLFRAELPSIERAFAAPGPEVLLMSGHPPLNIDPAIGRWWLKSADDTIVLQLQENFIGLNWRRRSALDVPPEYPGYDEMASRFHRYVGMLKAWHEDRGGTLPQPVACELLYDDLVQFQPQTERAELSSILQFWPSQKQRMVGWNTGWLEPLDGEGSDVAMNGAVMRFAAMAATVTDPIAPATPRPIVRLSFVAMCPSDSWSGVAAFLQAAHAHIRTRFIDIIVPEARQAWGEK